MITKKWEQPLSYGEYEHQSPLCKLALTLPKVGFSLQNVRNLSFFSLTTYLLGKKDLDMIFALQIHTGVTDREVLIHQQCTNTLRISLSRWEGPSSKHEL